MRNFESVQPKNVLEHELIDPQREAYLFQTIKNGVDLDAAMHEYRLRRTGDRTIQLIDIVPDFATDGAKEAHGEICLGYMRLVNSVVHRSSTAGSRLSHDYDDKVQNGYLGLSQAVWVFDPDRGIPFKNFAAQRIKNSIYRGDSNTNAPFNIPKNIFQKYVTHAINVKHRNGDDSPDTFIELFDQEKYPNKRKLKDVFQAFQSIVSLDDVLDTERREINDLEGDESFVEVDRLLQADEDLFELVEYNLSPEMIQAIGELGDRERHILLARTGLIGEGEQTLQAIGRTIGISRERVRQIEARVSCKLRAREQQIKTINASFKNQGTTESGALEALRQNQSKYHQWGRLKAAIEVRIGPLGKADLQQIEECAREATGDFTSKVPDLTDKRVFYSVFQRIIRNYIDIKPLLEDEAGKAVVATYG